MLYTRQKIGIATIATQLLLSHRHIPGEFHFAHPCDTHRTVASHQHAIGKDQGNQQTLLARFMRLDLHRQAPH